MEMIRHHLPIYLDWNMEEVDGGVMFDRLIIERAVNL